MEAFLVTPAVDILNSDFKTDIDVMFGHSTGESYVLLNDALRDPSLLKPLDEVFEFNMPLNYLNENLNFSSSVYIICAFRYVIQSYNFLFSHLLAISQYLKANKNQIFWGKWPHLLGYIVQLHWTGDGHFIRLFL